jgi:DNA-binding transcriptional ArsR family regulator
MEDQSDESIGSRRRRLPSDLGLGLPEKTRKALQHPIRRLILRRLHEGCPQSPIQMMNLVPGVSISLISYHAGVLRKCGTVRLTERRPVRGVTQHFYASEVTDDEEVVNVLTETEELDRDVGAA